MAVYLTLTVLTVLLGAFVKNAEYVKLHKSVQKPAVAVPMMQAKTCVHMTGYGRRHGGFNRQQTLNFCMAAAVFLLLAGVSACRIAVGNDYWVYRFQFNLIMQGRHVSYEWGFNLVVWLIQSLFGYDNYLPVFAVFSIATAYFMVKALYDQAEWFGFSVFLLMTGGYYFSSLNSVRYYFVLAIVMYAAKYAIHKEYGKFILWICFAACFHKSVLIVLPVYIGAGWLADKKIHKAFYVAGGLFVASLLVFQDFYRSIIFFFYPYYENSAFDQVDISVTNIAKCVGVLVLALLYYKGTIKDNVVNRFYFLLNLGGFVIYTFANFIPEISRIGYYLIVTQIFFIPSMLRRIENKRWRLFFSAGVAVAFIGYFALFLRSAYSVDVRILPYLNWIFN